MTVSYQNAFNIVPMHPRARAGARPPSFIEAPIVRRAAAAPWRLLGLADQPPVTPLVIPASQIDAAADACFRPWRPPKRVSEGMASLARDHSHLRSATLADAV